MGFYRVFKYELFRILSQVSPRNIFIIIPLVTFSFLTLIYIKGVIRENPVAVMDLDHSQLSRTLSQMINQSNGTEVKLHLTSEQKIDRVFLDYPEITAIVVIPKDFDADIRKGRSKTVTIFTNSANIVIGNILKKELLTITNTFAGGVQIKKLLNKDFTYNEALALVLPIKVNTHSLYNPWYNYLFYLTPGLMTVLLQMIVFFVAARSINGDITRGNYPRIFELSGKNPLILILGKIAAITFMGMVVSILIIGIMYPIFGITVNGSYLSLFLLFFLLVLSSAALGIMISTIFSEEIMAMDIAFVYNSPAFVFSGFTFPIMGMPWYDNFYAQLIPYTHFLKGFFQVYQMDAPFRYILPSIQALLVFFFAGLIVSLVLLMIKQPKLILNTGD